MMGCLGWLIYALTQLKESSPTCWDPFTWQYLNYYILLILTLGPAMTLGLAIMLVIMCLPCIGGQIYQSLRSERTRQEVSEAVIQSLAKRTFDPSLF